MENQENIESIIEQSKPIVDKIINDEYPGYKLIDCVVQNKYFSDTSLDIPEPGKKYAQILTPGYEITLSLEDKRLAGTIKRTYHSNISGTYVRQNVKKD